MESELFGHERGAFTSADAPRVGRFELADGGTILLDEVTEISLPLQAKLLRVLQERTFERVGSSETHAVDVRVLATSNRDLRDEVSQGRFREDLYFRLAVVPLHVPPLRERQEDVPELAAHFLQQSARAAGQAPRRTGSRCPRSAGHITHWPGNVRELENLITRASVLLGEAGDHAARSATLADRSRRPRPRTHEHSIRRRQSRVGVNLQDMERQTDRSDAGALSRPPRANGTSPGDRRADADQQTTGVRVRPASQGLGTGRLRIQMDGSR